MTEHRERVLRIERTFDAPVERSRVDYRGALLGGPAATAENAVRAETSMPRSPRSSVTCRAESG